MSQSRTRKSHIPVLALALLPLGIAASAHASDVLYSVDANVAPGVNVGVTNVPPPRPVYVQPAPVVVAPQPVYVQPAPEVRYVESRWRKHRERERREHWEREHWEHERHEHHDHGHHDH
jgi:hypothetical protein